MKRIVRVLILAAALLAIAAPVLGDTYGGPWPKSHTPNGGEWTR